MHYVGQLEICETWLCFIIFCFLMCCLDLNNIALLILKSLINVTTLAPPEARQILARWALLGYELSVLKARTIVDTRTAKEYLQLSGLIVGNEWNVLVNGGEQYNPFCLGDASIIPMVLTSFRFRTCTI